jgi:hypothetical protein
MKTHPALAPKVLAVLASAALISVGCTGEPKTTPATTANEVSPDAHGDDRETAADAAPPDDPRALHPGSPQQQGDQPAGDEKAQGDQSPITGTQGTSGQGRASADPTYGGTTGTTEGTGWEESPASDEDEENQKKKSVNQ